MLRVHAGPVATQVIYLEVGVDAYAIGPSQRDAMGRARCAFDCELPIAITGEVPYPEKASIRLWLCEGEKVGHKRVSEMRGIDENFLGHQAAS